jgi:hypothetical protein
MKSLLVDAMRQANKGSDDAALSDSGSFDTTSDQFAETANDAEVKAPDALADDLQLLDHNAPAAEAVAVSAPTAEAVAVDSIDIDEDQGSVQLPDVVLPETPGDTELSIEEATFDVAVPVVRRAPRMSRFSPAICLTLFLAAGFAWTAWQNWQEQAAGSVLGASRIPGAPAGSAQNSAEMASTVERFPFIAATVPEAGAEVEQ